MAKYFLLLLCGLTLGLSLHASLKLSGKISKYAITMELTASKADKNYNVRGRYQYVGKTQFLDIKGNYYPGGVMHLVESFAGKETGEFFVQTEDSEVDFSGKWIGNGKALDVDLNITEGEPEALAPYVLDDYTGKVNTSLTGSYASVYYWVNDFQSSDDNPNLEIGFNGGVVTITEVAGGKIEFSFGLTCGPTYHGAYLSGTATKVGPHEYAYKGSPMDDDAICEIGFTFGEKYVKIHQSDNTNGMDCGFGARAYAEGTFSKVNDLVVESDGEISIEQALGK